MDLLRSRWKFDECFSVDCVGRGGGLVLLWRNDMIVEVLSYSRFHIDVQVCEHNGDKPWRFIGFYGKPYTSKRQES